MSYSTTPPSDGPALLRALHDHHHRQEREARMARYRHQLVTAGAFDPDELSEQAQRILRWLTDWDDWTVDGIAEMLAATRTAAQAVHRQSIDRKVGALRESEAAVEAALTRYDERDARPTTPNDPDTSSFTIGLVLDVAHVIEEHGNATFEERDFVELQQHLLHLLHGRGGSCTGGPRR